MRLAQDITTMTGDVPRSGIDQKLAERAIRMLESTPILKDAVEKLRCELEWLGCDREEGGTYGPE